MGEECKGLVGLIEGAQPVMSLSLFYFIDLPI